MNSIEKCRSIFFDDVWMKRAHFFQFLANGFQAMNQILGEMFAFALAHFDQIGERDAQRSFDGGPCIFGLSVCFRNAHDTRRL